MSHLAHSQIGHFSQVDWSKVTCAIMLCASSKKDMPSSQCEPVSHFEQLKKLVFIIVNVIIMGFKL
jgi:hypothetical protein